MNWACIFASVVTLTAVVSWALASWHPPEWVIALIITGLLFGIVYVIGPRLERTFRQWLRQP